VGARNLFDFSANGVIRALVDAYIKSEGKIDFPVQIVNDLKDQSSFFEPIEDPER